MTEIKVPALPESVSDGVVVAWHKQPGEAIQRDEALVDIEKAGEKLRVTLF